MSDQQNSHHQLSLLTEKSSENARNIPSTATPPLVLTMTLLPICKAAACKKCGLL